MTLEHHASLRAIVRQTVDDTPVFDIHTHLYDRPFGDLLLWGVDELLTYHYLIAEAFRWLDLPYDKFWVMPKAQQAEIIWDHLFIKHSPISEACRGVLTVFNALGFDVKKRDLSLLRAHYAKWDVKDFIDRCLDAGHVRKVCMTNSPFDDEERGYWMKGIDGERDPRFVAALRVDQLVLDWPNTAPKLKAWGYDVSPELNAKTYDGIRRFLADWARRMDAQYCMVSLPAEFEFPSEDASAKIIEHGLMPYCRENGMALALMIGVHRGANPELRLAGDSVSPSDVSAVERLCAAFPENKFLCTLLSRNDQHSLCVAARKFRNLHIFGCWWFMNNPSLIDETTRMRLEMLGLSCTPQHSDCRVLDQLIYKWQHSRAIIADVLAEKYADLTATGWDVTPAEIRRDIQSLLGGTFEEFVGRS